MPDTPTTRLALYKSKSDGSELVNYSTDIGGNLDKLDTAAGWLPVTSSTHPSSPWNGQAIRETDTGRYKIWDTSAWTELVTPNASATFTAKSVWHGAATTTSMLGAALTTDTVDRFSITAGGTLGWSAGSGAVDTNLYRSAANVLKTDDSLTVAGDLTIGSRAMGRGLVSSVSLTQVSLSTTNETVIGTVPSFAWKNGRAYRFKCQAYVSATSATYFYTRVRKGSSTTTGNLYIDQIRVPIVSTSLSVNAYYDVDTILINTSGADITTALTITGQVASGTGQWSNNGMSVNSYATVEDIGLATDWPGAAIS